MMVNLRRYFRISAYTRNIETAAPQPNTEEYASYFSIFEVSPKINAGIKTEHYGNRVQSFIPEFRPDSCRLKSNSSKCWSSVISHQNTSDVLKVRILRFFGTAVLESLYERLRSTVSGNLYSRCHC